MRVSAHRLVLLLSFATTLLGSRTSSAQPPTESLERDESTTESALEDPVFFAPRIERVEVAWAGDTAERPALLQSIVGQRATRSNLRALLTELLGNGRFADVQFELVPIERDTASLQVRLRTRLVLREISFVGNGEISNVELQRVVSDEPGDELRDLSAAHVQLAIKRLYSERGFEEVDVQAEYIPGETEGDRRLEIRIQEGEPTRLLGVSIEGLDPEAARYFRDALTLEEVYAPAPVAEAFSNAAESLRTLGWFEAEIGDVEVERRRAGVLLRVRPNLGPRFQVRITEPYPLTRQQVLDALGVGNARLTPLVRREMGERLVDLLRRRGYVGAEAQVRRTAVPDATPGEAQAFLDVSFRPGEQLRVVGRSYPGLEHFSSGYIDDQIATFVEAEMSLDGLLGSVDNDVADRLVSRRPDARELPPPPSSDPLSVWYPPAYSDARQHILELYLADGFLAADVGEPELRMLLDGRAVVVMPIVEGPRARVFDVEISGNAALTQNAVINALGLERDQPFSYLALEQAERALKERYQEEGYYFAEVHSSARFSASGTRAQVRIQIQERFPVRVGEIVFEGAEFTSESLMANMLAFESGDLLRPSRLRETRERLMELGVFGAVNVAPRDPELAEQVKDVIITVAERRRQYFTGGAGVSTGQGVRGRLEYGHRNLFGRGIALTLSARAGYQVFFLQETLRDRFLELPIFDQIERVVSVSLSLPYIGLPNLRATLSFSHQRENERNFGLTKNGADLTFTWRALRSVTVGFRGSFESNDVDVLGGESYQQLLRDTASDVRLRNLLRVPEGRSSIGATGVQFTVDARDNPFDPSRGYLFRAEVEWARTIATEEIDGESFFSNHLSVELGASAYLPLGEHDDWVWAFQGKFGRMIHLSEQSVTYPNRQFFLGGVNSIRGFLQDALIPQDLADELLANPDLTPDGLVQGGDTYLLLRTELRFPLIGDLRGGVFFDFGNLWRETGQLDPLSLRPTAGVGLRFSTPIGPLALDYGIPLNRRSALNEPFGSFHFSIGLF